MHSNSSQISINPVKWGCFEKVYLCSMKTLTLTLPDNLEVDNNDLTMLLATRLYEQGKLSLGQAAELAGYTKRAFTELLSKYGVSIFNYPATEIFQDVTNA